MTIEKNYYILYSVAKVDLSATLKFPRRDWAPLSHSKSVDFS